MILHNNITDELAGMGSPLADLSHVMPYALPAQYFDKFPNILAAVIKVENEEYPALALPKINQFIAPVDYFNNLPEEVLAGAIAGDIRADAGIHLPFSVPDSFFETFPESVATLAMEASVRKKAGSHLFYTIPADYFDTLPVTVLKAAKAQKNRIITLGNLWQQARLAAAAILLLSIGLGTMLHYMQRPESNTERALADVPKSMISEYVQLNIDDFDQEMIYSSIGPNTPIQPEQLTKDEIIRYLNETGWSAD